jgi:hypothetical protein
MEWQKIVAPVTPEPTEEDPLGRKPMQVSNAALASRCVGRKRVFLGAQPRTYVRSCASAANVTDCFPSPPRVGWQGWYVRRSVIVLHTARGMGLSVAQVFVSFFFNPFPVGLREVTGEDIEPPPLSFYLTIPPGWLGDRGSLSRIGLCLVCDFGCPGRAVKGS